jgi:hypothetical protein
MAAAQLTHLYSLPYFYHRFKFTVDKHIQNNNSSFRHSSYGKGLYDTLPPTDPLPVDVDGRTGSLHLGPCIRPSVPHMLE